MPTVIGVKFRQVGHRHYYNPGSLLPREGEAVIVPTVNGPEYATVCQAAHEMEEEMAPLPLRQVTRLASPDDQRRMETILQREEQAYTLCRERIAAHKLDMKLISCEYAFDNSRMTAYFTSGGRVDFRALVKDLAGLFKTRIELKQIGVRDEAKMLGGVGSCGRGLCCSNFLYEFQPVSIRMAKEQSLSLNPTKISGVCGRLLCCLKYEQDQYEKSRKRLPKLGKEALTPDGPGVVIAVNPLMETVKIRVSSGDTSEIRQYTAEQVQRVNPPQQVKAAPATRTRAVQPADPIAVVLDEEFLGTEPDLICDEGIILDEE